MPGGAGYDLNGNQTALPSRSFTYDAANRLTSTVQPAMGAISYVYDGNGHRVQKNVTKGTTTVATTYVYDGGGQLTAEYAGASSVSGTLFQIGDMLGSTRLVLDVSGNVVERMDYLPFGEEIPAVNGGRGDGYSAGVYPGDPDVDALKFTGKERDAESGLDFFGARYMSSGQGRFTSMDPAGATASLFNPQSWNGYAYTLNNPLKYVDPDGNLPIPVITGLVGAGIGGAVNALKEISEERATGSGELSPGRIATAFGGGALAGGLAGLTLGIGAGAGAAASAVEVGVVNAASTAIGDIAQHRANDALGLTEPGEHTNESANTIVDAITAGAAGIGGSILADKLIPIPNVKKEIALLTFANRRSTRAARQAAASFNGQIRAAFNSTFGGAVQTYLQTVQQLFWSFTSDPRQTQEARKQLQQGCSTSTFNGQAIGGSCPQ